MNKINLEPSWFEILSEEFEKPYFLDLNAFLVEQKALGKTIYPPENQIFAALNHCPFDDVKVVIIGQDPYHGPGQANGLCFSVNTEFPIPPSLNNIYKEIERDLGGKIPTNGDLSEWAKQGVLMLNATLTVEANHAGSHQKKGWEIFTNAIIQKLNARRQNLVFMLWGGYAKKKGKIIDREKHLALESGHPSPLSANRGYWFGNKHFSQCNDYLSNNRSAPIQWN